MALGPEYDFDFFVGGHHMHYRIYKHVKLCVEYFADVLEGATAAVERFSRLMRWPTS